MQVGPPEHLLGGLLNPVFFLATSWWAPHNTTKHVSTHNGKAESEGSLALPRQGVQLVCSPGMAGVPLSDEISGIQRMGTTL